MGKRRKNAAVQVVSTNLRKVLLDRQMSARAGAALAGVAQTTFTSWVNGSALPMDFRALQKFCTGAGVNLEWLLTGKIETPKANDAGEIFEIVPGEPALSGVYLIEAKRVRPKGGR